jgi:hypothetical protein
MGRFTFHKIIDYYLSLQKNDILQIKILLNSLSTLPKAIKSKSRQENREDYEKMNHKHKKNERMFKDFSRKVIK